MGQSWRALPVYLSQTKSAYLFPDMGSKKKSVVNSYCWFNLDRDPYKWSVNHIGDLYLYTFNPSTSKKETIKISLKELEQGAVGERFYVFFLNFFCLVVSQRLNGGIWQWILSNKVINQVELQNDQWGFQVGPGPEWVWLQGLPVVVGQKGGPDSSGSLEQHI